MKSINPCDTFLRRLARAITRINDRCIFACAIVLITALSFISRIPAAPVQWDVGSGGNGHYYEAVQVPDGVSWTAATPCH